MCMHTKKLRDEQKKSQEDTIEIVHELITIIEIVNKNHSAEMN